MKAIIFSAVFCVSFLSACAVQRAENPPVENPKPVVASDSTREPVLVELFTSEGCSSCPPADRELAFLETAQPVAGAEVITLAFHVDYWDGPAWKDAFSSAEFSERQNRYAQRMKLDSSYTPQMVVDGTTEFVGSDGNRANEAIRNEAAKAKSKIDLKLSGETAAIELENIGKHQPATLYLATAEDNLSTNVKGGENGGRKLSHMSVVRKLDKIGQLADGADGLKINVKLPSDPAWKKKDLKYVVFAQEDLSGRVIAVGRAKT